MITPWKRDGDKLICAHGTYELPVTCPICAESPGDIHDEIDEPLPEPPIGCLSSTQHEQRLIKLADYLEEKAKDLCVDKGRINYATAARLFEVSIKALREAGQLAGVRERRAYVKQREKRIRDRMRKLGN